MVVERHAFATGEYWYYFDTCIEITWIATCQQSNGRFFPEFNHEINSGRMGASCTKNKLIYLRLDHGFIRAEV